MKSVQRTATNNQPDQMQPLVLTSLPDDVLRLIFSHLSSFSDIATLSKVNRRIYELSKGWRLWKILGEKIAKSAPFQTSEQAREYLREFRPIAISLSKIINLPIPNSWSIDWLAHMKKSIKPIQKADTLSLWQLLDPSQAPPATSKRVKRAFSKWIEDNQERCQAKDAEIQFHDSIMKILPKEIGLLKQLTELHLENTELFFLPTEIGSCEQLKKITIKRNPITSLPSTIGELHKLAILILSNNSLESVPDTIGDCSSLEQLWISHNKITQLPSTLGKLHNLLCFHAESNELQEIPFSTQELKNLEEFWVFSNYIRTIPHDLTRLNNKVAPCSDGEALMKDSDVTFEESNGSRKPPGHDIHN